ncbi:MAG: glycosyltransferase family 2 protein [Victivallaceae bacterium]|nr:glycosyltransferase family 2 protein [Victivallaceae bacterium]
MYNNQKVAIVMPAYNAAETLVKTYKEVKNQAFVDSIIIVDDCSIDNTAEIARKECPEAHFYQTPGNSGYGANQKLCYQAALELGADIIIMVHPDYQYTPQLIPAMAALIGSGLYHCVMGSRILGGCALKGGMPVWKYVCNRFLTFFQNCFLGAKLSEYHSGYRGYSRHLLEQLPLRENSDNFVFDNQVLAEIIWQGYVIAEISCPTKYFTDASSISFVRSIFYGLGCLSTTFLFLAARFRFINSKCFQRETFKAASGRSAGKNGK